MASSWNAQYAKCPFYKSDHRGKRTVTCHGVCEGSTISMTFQSEQTFETQVKTFCRDKYKNCEIARMLESVYEEE